MEVAKPTHHNATPPDYRTMQVFALAFGSLLQTLLNTAIALIQLYKGGEPAARLNFECGSRQNFVKCTTNW